MNKLKRYLLENDMTPSDFSRLSGIPQPTVWRIAEGKSKPNCLNLRLIEKHTHKKVTYADFDYQKRKGKAQ